MVFSKKTLTTHEFCRNFLWIFLDEINKEWEKEILNALKQENIKINKNKRELQIEIGLWIHHIIGKSLGESQLINPFTPEAIKENQEFLEYCHEKWGKDENRDSFIANIKNENIERIKAYEAYEGPYSRGEILIEDFEAMVAVILLDIKYKELTKPLIKIIEELHKGTTLLIWKYLKDFSSKYKLVN